MTFLLLRVVRAILVSGVFPRVEMFLSPCGNVFSSCGNIFSPCGNVIFLVWKWVGAYGSFVSWQGGMDEHEWRCCPNVVTSGGGQASSAANPRLSTMLAPCLSGRKPSCNSLKFIVFRRREACRWSRSSELRPPSAGLLPPKWSFCPLKLTISAPQTDHFRPSKQSRGDGMCCGKTRQHIR